MNDLRPRTEALHRHIDDFAAQTPKDFGDLSHEESEKYLDLSNRRLSAMRYDLVLIKSALCAKRRDIAKAAKKAGY